VFNLQLIIFIIIARAIKSILYRLKLVKHTWLVFFDCRLNVPLFFDQKS